MAHSLSLTKLLKTCKAQKKGCSGDFKNEIQRLQLKMLRIQQGVWHKRSRAVIIFEGFDAAGKGGAIRKLTEILDPRGFRVHPIGPPSLDEQGKHWLYRFWSLLPSPGTIAVFDRSWYGRVLVERVDELTGRENWKRAFNEINEFEKMLQDDGVDLIKIFLSITKDEQLKRFEERLKDPYKQWKLSKADIQARKKWDQYVEAVDDLFKRTNLRSAQWHLVPADNKPYARKEVLRIVTSELKVCEAWIEKQASKLGKRSIETAIKKLGKKRKDICS